MTEAKQRLYRKLVLNFYLAEQLLEKDMDHAGGVRAARAPGSATPEQPDSASDEAVTDAQEPEGDA